MTHATPASLRPLLALLTLAAACWLPARAGALPPAGRLAIENFLRTQVPPGIGTVVVTLGDPSAPLPACDTLRPFLPAGVKAWGRLSVGVRCTGERPWTRYLRAQVSVHGNYLAAAGPIEAGAPLNAQDVATLTGDLTTLPGAVLTDAAQLAGATAASRIAAGAPLRSDQLRRSPVVRRGQPVQLLFSGNGFALSTQGKALTDAAAGELIQIKTAQGRVVSAVAGADGRATVSGSMEAQP